MGQEPRRASLPARHNRDFSDRVLVACPGCGGEAMVEDHSPPDGRAVRRMTCAACPTVREAEVFGAEPGLGLPLRLVASTRHGELRALNYEHLAYIEAYVAGELREERREPDGLRNGSIVSRLPRWVKAAKNRNEVLAAIRKLRSQRLS